MSTTASISAALNADVILYSSQVTRDSAIELLKQINSRPALRRNVALVISTYGGSPDAAYRIARIIRSKYPPPGQFSVYVFGPCKSAGTLIALGADEVVMGDLGELGPIDIQVPKDDDTVFRSGLDVEAAIKKTGSLAYLLMNGYFYEISRLGAGITTKTALEQARLMATELTRPIMEQVEPLRVGENARSLDILSQYARRLLMQRKSPPQSDSVEKLIQSLTNDFPSHGFVIDREEASELLKPVRIGVRAPIDDVTLAESVEAHLETVLEPFIIRPRENMILFIEPVEVPAQTEMFDTPADHDAAATAEEDEEETPGFEGDGAAGAGAPDGGASPSHAENAPEGVDPDGA